MSTSRSAIEPSDDINTTIWDFIPTVGKFENSFKFVLLTSNSLMRYCKINVPITIWDKKIDISFQRVDCFISAVTNEIIFNVCKAFFLQWLTCFSIFIIFLLVLCMRWYCNVLNWNLCHLPMWMWLCVNEFVFKWLSYDWIYEWCETCICVRCF